MTYLCSLLLCSNFVFFSLSNNLRLERITIYCRDADLHSGEVFRFKLNVVARLAFEVLESRQAFEPKRRFCRRFRCRKRVWNFLITREYVCKCRRAKLNYISSRFVQLCFSNLTETILSSVVQRVNNSIQRIKSIKTDTFYPLDSGLPVYPLDRVVRSLNNWEPVFCALTCNLRHEDLYEVKWRVVWRLCLFGLRNLL